MAINGSELKQYVLGTIFDYYIELGKKDLKPEERNILELKLSILEDIKIICEKRGRY